MQKNAVVLLEQLPALKLADDERVQKKFISMYNKIHGSDRGTMIYEAEKFYFTKQLTESPGLQDCSRLSLYGAFIDVSVQGLSFDPTKKLCYLVPYTVNAGTRENPKWEKRASLQISPYGELYLRQMYGQIRSADNPEVVYEGEDFSIITNGAGKVVNHKITYPRPEGAIIAVYIRLVKNDGTSDYYVMDLPGMQRLKGYSERKNNGKANALYGGESGKPDKGFMIAKCIKHAFAAYPKVKLKGQFSKLETEEEDNEDAVDYGFEEVPANHDNGQQKSTEAAAMTMAGETDQELDF